ncbi:MAG: LacI family transcriptional regulator [Chloroflexi bacterium]|jgi:LacI family transcriptional regulator|nr:LacI family transcriptional regulator [Chloroflexota bacterium]
MATIRDVAALAGVSTTTVSHVINNSRFVSPEVRERVYQAMEELRYQPNALARSLRQGKTNTIGLLSPNSANPYFAEIGRAVEDAAFTSRYSVIICNTEGKQEKESFYLDVLSKKRVDGIILVGISQTNETLDRLLAKGVPVVLVDREIPDLDVDLVLTDNKHAGYLATRHLIEQGHTRIACVTGPAHVHPSSRRVVGYQEALQEAGLPLQEEYILPGDFSAQSGWEATRTLLALPQPPSAIFLCNDLMAIGGLRAAAEAGFAVPQDLAIMGFDDIELASFTNPTLSSISQPKAEMGAIAVQMLLEQIEGKRSEPRQEILQPALIVRRSTVA